jgi:Cu/Ag efflux protein CusF
LIAASAAILTSCRSTPELTKQEKTEEPRRYALHGEILKLDDAGKIATIKHEAIGDWMGAMTMEFPVKDAKDYGELKVGAPVDATVFVQGTEYWVGEVRPVATPPAGAK